MRSSCSSSRSPRFTGLACVRVQDANLGRMTVVFMSLQLKDVHALIQNDLFEMKDALTAVRRSMSSREASVRSVQSK